jgi:hypothetical protein
MTKMLDVLQDYCYIRKYEVRLCCPRTHGRSLFALMAACLSPTGKLGFVIVLVVLTDRF